MTFLNSNSSQLDHAAERLGGSTLEITGPTHRIYFKGLVVVPVVIVGGFVAAIHALTIGDRRNEPISDRGSHKTMRIGADAPRMIFFAVVAQVRLVMTKQGERFSASFTSLVGLFFRAVAHLRHHPWLLHDLVVERLKLGHRFVRDALTALPGVDSGNGRLIDAGSALDFLLGETRSEQFGDESFSVHSHHDIANALAIQVQKPLSKVIGLPITIAL
jgi:hypothetical protein